MLQTPSLLATLFPEVLPGLCLSLVSCYATRFTIEPSLLYLRTRRDALYTYIQPLSSLSAYNCFPKTVLPILLIPLLLAIYRTTSQEPLYLLWQTLCNIDYRTAQTSES